MDVINTESSGKGSGKIELYLTNGQDTLKLYASENSAGNETRTTKANSGFKEIQFEQSEFQDSTSLSPSMTTFKSEKPCSMSTEMTPRLPSTFRKRDGITLPFLNVAVLGPSNSGKSTLVGHLLHLCDAIDDVIMELTINDTKNTGKETLRYAWLLDKLKAERERGVSIDSKSRLLETKSYNVVLLDTPGHRDFVHNTITAVSQADVVLLVVSAVKSEFEGTIEKKGQTREFLNIAYSMGVKKLIVAVNKMDVTSPPYSEREFTMCQKSVKLLAQKAGFKTNHVIFIPISAFDGDNLITRSPTMSWYEKWDVVFGHSNHVTGTTLLDALEKTRKPTRMNSKPLRVPVHSVYKLGSIGIVATGRVHGGSLRPKMEVAFAPTELKRQVRAVQIFGEVTDEGRAGDNVGMQLEHLHLKDVRRGTVCGDVYDDPPREVRQITAQVRILNHPGSIKKGYSPILHCHTATTACKITRIIERTDEKTGLTAEDFPVSLSTGHVGIVEMIPLKPICVESFFDYPSMGRIVLRDMKQVVAVGIIVKVNKANYQDIKSLIQSANVTENGIGLKNEGEVYSRPGSEKRSTCMSIISNTTSQIPFEILDDVTEYNSEDEENSGTEIQTEQKNEDLYPNTCI